MKSIFYTFILLFGIASLSSGYAQANEGVFINQYSFNASSNEVLLSIKTTDSFIVGANRYVLHIGGKYFMRCEHPDGRLDEIIFFIPLADYEQLINQAQIFLVYGFYYENTKQDNEGSPETAIMGKHWKLGSFSAQQFTK